MRAPGLMLETDIYTLKAVAQDDFEDVEIPERGATPPSAAK